MTNGTVIASDGVPIVVDQGPAWLATLLYAPPGWVWPALGLVAAVAGVWAAVGYYRNGVDRAVLAEMATTTTVVLSIAVATGGLTALPAGGYLADLLGGVVGGFLLAQALLAGARRYGVGQQFWDGVTNADA